MRIRALLLVCIQVFVGEETYAQCFGYTPANMNSYYGSNFYNYRPYRENIDEAFFTRQLQMQMESLNLPSPSINIAADGLIINGAISVSGTLPFMSAVAVQGELPMCGTGMVQFNSAGTDFGVTEMPIYRTSYGPYSSIQYC
ncbi:unnamed protein product [Leptosia nina]|uniref:Uncharacterized protein n=1 Tax=Leptosia nina TaxID=320188 RepID=A0AAV1JMF3_9NEOP